MIFRKLGIIQVQQEKWVLYIKAYVHL